MDKKTSFQITALLAASSLIAILLNLSTVYSLASVGFILWGLSPYGGMAILIKLSRSNKAVISTLTLSVLIGLLGLILIIDAQWIHADAQSGLVFAVVPLWQWAILILALPLILWLNKSAQN
ncbi:MAG: hypothetical protein L3J38_02275 [Thiomicrorhabdus sp.]|nr:hypothetical protein [Thiomicrorhabdus sp.]